MIPEPDLIIGGKYRLLRALASGGMGSVWVAKHTQLDVAVAVKFMSAELATMASASTRFEREARAAAQLKSPHVVRIHDYGMEDGTAYIAMELFEGEDLAALLERERRLSPQRAAEILAQAAKALRAAHEARIVHRDIKPSNLFLARESGEIVVKVLDFGIAKETGPGAAGQQGATTTGVVLGSPLYMSPEQARGTSIDERSDLWSLGVVLFEMITGAQPFLGASVGDVIAKICGDELPVPSRFHADLAPEIDAFFARALARDPAARFPSARALSEAFAAVAAAPPTKSVVAPPGRLDATQPAAAAPVADTMVAPAIAASSALAIEPATRAITADPAPANGPRRRVAVVAIAAISAAMIGAYALRSGLGPTAGEAIEPAPSASPGVIATASASAEPTVAAPTAAATISAAAASAAPAKSAAAARPAASTRATASPVKPPATAVTIDPIFGLPVTK